jgi:hypothetical protein
MPYARPDKWYGLKLWLIGAGILCFAAVLTFLTTEPLPWDDCDPRLGRCIELQSPHTGQRKP